MGDKHVEMVQGHIAETDSHFTCAWPRLGPLAQLQGVRSVETNEFQSAHVDRVEGVTCTLFAPMIET